VSRPAPDFQPTSDARRAEDAFDCRATAALLRSMGTLVWASHAGALVAASYHAWIPLLGWGLAVYFAVRVQLDAGLLEMLARDPESAPEQLDAWLSRAGLRARGGDRSIAERCQGARRLARYLAGACLLQFGATAVAILSGNR